MSGTFGSHVKKHNRKGSTTLNFDLSMRTRKVEEAKARRQKRALVGSTTLKCLFTLQWEKVA